MSIEYRILATMIDLIEAPQDERIEKAVLLHRQVANKLYELIRDDKWKWDTFGGNTREGGIIGAHSSLSPNLKSRAVNIRMQGWIPPVYYPEGNYSSQYGLFFDLGQYHRCLDSIKATEKSTWLEAVKAKLPRLWDSRTYLKQPYPMPRKKESLKQAPYVGETLARLLIVEGCLHRVEQG